MKQSAIKRARNDVAAAANETAIPRLAHGGQNELITMQNEDIVTVAVIDSTVTRAAAVSSCTPDKLQTANGNGVPAVPCATTADGVAASSPPSPNGNRARFLAGVQPTKITCDLSTTPPTPGLRFTFEAVITVVYPASPNGDRRYIELSDAHGSSGITIWNNHVKVITPDCVGRVAKFTRLAITVHNGKKSLTMSKESTVQLEQPDYISSQTIWWNGLLKAPIHTALEFHDGSDSIVNVSGILGLIQVEEKMVKGVPKSLLVLHLTDATGRMEVRSWNHSDTEFLPFLEKAVILRRIRVVLYAGQKTGELLGGVNGTILDTDFDTSALMAYWRA